MSFQDVGKKRRPAGGGSNHASSSTATSSTAQKASMGAASNTGSYQSRDGSSGGSGFNINNAVNGAGGLSQISESLLQYQRNVGILEKIVQQGGQIMRNNNNNTNSSRYNNNSASIRELQMQCKAQLDVVYQLEQRVQRLIQLQIQEQIQNSSGTNNPQLVKLSKDFDRVQAQVTRLRKQIDSMQQSFINNNAVHDENEIAGKAAQESNTYQSDQERIQIQLQEDRLAEEIMREREQEIRNINKGMHQVNEIYKDLAHIVGSQQEQIDTIETQMEDSRMNAESGLQQVEKANEKYGQTNCVIS